MAKSVISSGEIDSKEQEMLAVGQGKKADLLPQQVRTDMLIVRRNRNTQYYSDPKTVSSVNRTESVKPNTPK